MNEYGAYFIEPAEGMGETALWVPYEPGSRRI